MDINSIIDEADSVPAKGIKTSAKKPAATQTKSNSGTVVVEIFRQLLDLDSQMQELKDDMKELKKTLKEDQEIPTKVTNGVLKLLKTAEFDEYNDTHDKILDLYAKIRNSK